MVLSAFQEWLSNGRIWLVAIMLFAAMCLAGAGGVLLRLRHDRRGGGALAPAGEGQEGYIVSAVLGLLALLMGFTFSLAVDRFETRRHLVLEQANAIQTTYLRAQLLAEPHRSRMSGLLIRYTDNVIALAKAAPRDPRRGVLLAADDALLIDIWAATSAAFETIKGLDFSSTYIYSVNTMIDLDAARRAARGARVPPEVFAVLVVYLVTTAAVLGYVLKGTRGRLGAGFLFLLLTLSLALTIDIDRPVVGGVIESQKPMEDMRRSLADSPPPVFDRWRTPPR
jgi:hypothetical protein